MAGARVASPSSEGDLICHYGSALGSRTSRPSRWREPVVAVPPTVGLTRAAAHGYHGNSQCDLLVVHDVRALKRNQRPQFVGNFRSNVELGLAFVSHQLEEIR